MTLRYVLTQLAVASCLPLLCAFILSLIFVSKLKNDVRACVVMHRDMAENILFMKQANKLCLGELARCRGSNP